MSPSPRSLAPLLAVLLLCPLIGACRDEGDGSALVYVIDSLRWDALGCAGSPTIETPRIDAIAAEGTYFPNAYVSSPRSKPSVTSLVTGMHPPAHGVELPEQALHASIPVLPDAFRSAGYRTALVTGHPAVSAAAGLARGWDTVIEVRGEEGEPIARSAELHARALEWLDAGEGPFLLVIHSVDAHRPYHPPEDWDRYGRLVASRFTGDLADTERTDLRTEDVVRLRSLQAGEIAYNDATFGELVDGLRERGLFEGLLTVVTSSRGEEFWERKQARRNAHAYDSSVRVPMIVRLPGAVPAGALERAPVQVVDVLPTALALGGVPVPDGIDGAPLFEEGAFVGEGRAFATLPVDGGRNSAERFKRWKLLHERRPPASELKPVRRRLFDMTSDTREVSDERALYPDVVETLTRRMKKQLTEQRERGDALRGGPAPLVEPSAVDAASRAAMAALGYPAPGDAD
jgi:arylsulfatase A-like enzyme